MTIKGVVGALAFTRCMLKTISRMCGEGASKRMRSSVEARDSVSCSGVALSETKQSTGRPCESRSMERMPARITSISEMIRICIAFSADQAVSILTALLVPARTLPAAETV
jgi:hypothetical protein